MLTQFVMTEHQYNINQIYQSAIRLDLTHAVGLLCLRLSVDWATGRSYRELRLQIYLNGGLWTGEHFCI